MSATKPKRMDLRTKIGRREEILEQIRQHEGFSIFWVSENPLRALVAMEMQKSGEIETSNNIRGFPWIDAAITRRASRRRSNRQPESTGEPGGRSGVGSEFEGNTEGLASTADGGKSKL